MRRIPFALCLATIALASCSDDAPSEEPTPAASEAPESVEVDRDYISVAGRWSTASGALPNGNRIILDIASNGRFSIDVRQQGESGDAIVETARGDTQKQGNIISGTTEAGNGAHSVLEQYSRWTLNTETGQITGEQNQPISIAKE